MLWFGRGVVALLGGVGLGVGVSSGDEIKSGISVVKVAAVGVGVFLLVQAVKNK